MSSPPLSDEELRVLACLVEKSHTTPEQYPLSTNALTAACNQKTSREPVVDYSPQLVDRVLRLLRDGDWVRSDRGRTDRSFKHRHLFDQRLGLDNAEQAVLAVLALRGPQSPGELKTRTERYHPFADLDEVEEVLDGLAAREPALVRNVGRASGQSQDRWIQLVGAVPGAATPSSGAGGPVGAATPSASMPADRATPAPMVAPSTGASAATGAAASTGAAEGDDGEVRELRRRVGELERRLARLEDALGVEDDVPGA